MIELFDILIKGFIVFYNLNAIPPLELATPTPTPAAVVISTKKDEKPNPSLLTDINNYRKSLGLNAFVTNDIVCNFAKKRAQELTVNFSHEGSNPPYPSYSNTAENIASANSKEEVLDLWKNSDGHNKNLLSNAKFACTANSGKFYTFESWTP